jgi:hypothetical protein
MQGQPPNSPPGYGPPPQGYAPQGQGAPQGYGAPPGYGAPQAQAYGPGGGRIRVEGSVLVCPIGGCIDVACVKCGTPQGIFPVIQEFEWLPTWAKIVTLFLRGGLARFVRQSAMVQAPMTVPLCDPCQKAWQSTKKLEWLIPLGGVVGMILCFVLFGQIANAIEVPIIGLLGLLLGFAVLFAIYPAQKILIERKRVVPNKIKDGFIWFDGVHVEALKRFSGQG